MRRAFDLPQLPCFSKAIVEGADFTLGTRNNKLLYSSVRTDRDHCQMTLKVLIREIIPF